MKHLLSVADLGADGIEEVMRVTDSFVEVSERAIPRVPALRGRPKSVSASSAARIVRPVKSTSSTSTTCRPVRSTVMSVTASGITGRSPMSSR